MRIDTGKTIAAGATVTSQVLSTAKVPLETGEFARVQTYYRTDHTVSAPAGVNIGSSFGFYLFDASDTFVGSVALSVTPNYGGTFALSQTSAAITGNVAYGRFVFQTSVVNTTGSPVTTSGVWCDSRFDDISSVLQQTAFEVTPALTAYTPNTQPLTASTGVGVNQATISIAASTITFPDGNVNYSSGSISPLNDATTYFVIADDPTYSGGAVTYQATTSNPTVTSQNGFAYFGLITTPVHGGGGTGGDGGGSGACFTPFTYVHTKNGLVAICELNVGDEVVTMAGFRKVKRLISHEYDGPMHHLPFSGMATPCHRLWNGKSWQKAGSLYRKCYKPFKGTVHNLEIEGETEQEHNYLLECGLFAHNLRKE